MKLRFKIKIFFFVIFAAICFAQCFIILINYLGYPTVIDIYDVSPNLLSVLPGLTICNNNRLSLRKIIRRHPHIGRAMQIRFPSWTSNNEPFVDLEKFNQFRDETHKIYESFNFTPQVEKDNSTLDDLFYLQPNSEDFIKWLACPKAWVDSVECGSITRIDSIQDRKCTTILHKGALVYDQANQPHLFYPPNSTNSSNFSYFHAKEVIQLVLDFVPEDYGDLRRQVGARIMFHGKNFVASASELDFFITRGYRYDFMIDREVSILLDKPYIGCYNYEMNNINKFKTKLNPRVPLYLDTCFQNCVITNIIHRSHCWPPTMPYFRNDTLDPERKYKACIWAKDTLYSSLYREMLRVMKLKNKRNPNQAQTSTTEIPVDKEDKSKAEARLYTKVRRFCRNKCMLDCTFTRYSVSVTRSVWPTDIRISLDKTGSNRLLRHCCALVTVKLSHFHHTVEEFNPRYNLIDTIGNVGGLLAVWLGLSIISVYKAVQRLIEISRLSKVNVEPYEVS